MKSIEREDSSRMNSSFSHNESEDDMINTDSHFGLTAMFQHEDDIPIMDQGVLKQSHYNKSSLSNKQSIQLLKRKSHMFDNLKRKESLRANHRMQSFNKLNRYRQTDKTQPSQFWDISVSNPSTVSLNHTTESFIKSTESHLMSQHNISHYQTHNDILLNSFIDQTPIEFLHASHTIHTTPPYPVSDIHTPDSICLKTIESAPLNTFRRFSMLPFRHSFQSSSHIHTTFNVPIDGTMSNSSFQIPSPQYLNPDQHSYKDIKQPHYVISNTKASENPMALSYTRMHRVQDNPLGKRMSLSWKHLNDKLKKHKKLRDSARAYVNNDIEHIRLSLRYHQDLWGQTTPNMANVLSENEFEGIAQAWGFNPHRIHQWCHTGMTCWMAFEFYDPRLGNREILYLKKQHNMSYTHKQKRNVKHCHRQHMVYCSIYPLHKKVTFHKHVHDPSIQECPKDVITPVYRSNSQPLQSDQTINQMVKRLWSDQPKQHTSTNKSVVQQTNTSDKYDNQTLYSSRHKHHVSHQILKLYLKSRIIPGGARRWDEHGVCWVARQYNVLLHCGTGQLLLQKQLSPYHLAKTQYKQSAEKINRIVNNTGPEMTNTKNILAKNDINLPNDQSSIPAVCNMQFIRVKSLKWWSLESVTQLQSFQHSGNKKDILGGLGCIGMAMLSVNSPNLHPMSPNTSESLQNSGRKTVFLWSNSNKMTQKNKNNVRDKTSIASKNLSIPSKQFDRPISTKPSLISLSNNNNVKHTMKDTKRKELTNLTTQYKRFKNKRSNGAMSQNPCKNIVTRINKKNAINKTIEYKKLDSYALASAVTGDMTYNKHSIGNVAILRFRYELHSLIIVFDTVNDCQEFIRIVNFLVDDHNAFIN